MQCTARMHEFAARLVSDFPFKAGEFFVHKKCPTREGALLSLARGPGKRRDSLPPFAIVLVVDFWQMPGQERRDVGTERKFPVFNET